MKKIFALLMSFILVLLAVGCGGNGNSGNKVSDGMSSSVGTPQNESTTNNISSNGSTIGSSSTASNEDTPFKLTIAESYTKFQSNSVVICFGDSITEGMGMTQGYDYPHQLQANLKGQYRVINAGVSGEKMEAITSRANAANFVLTNDVVFPVGTDKVALNRELFSYADGTKIQYLAFGKGLAQNRVIIGGVKYNIEYKKGGTDGRDGTYTLVRSDSTKALTLKKGTLVKYDYSEQFSSCHVAVVLMGANGGPSVEKRIAECKKFAEYYDKYIIICPFYGADDIEKYEAAFGKNVANPRKYGYESAHKAYDLEITKTDEWCILKKRMPATFLYKGNKEGCHMSELGYKLLADVVYQKGVELGYWK